MAASAHMATRANAGGYGRRLWGVPIVVVFFFLGMVLPTAISVSAGGLRLSAYRVVLLVMFVPMLFTLISGKRGALNIFDGFAIAHSVWALLALIKWGGLAQGIESGGIYIVEALGAYLVGRLYIRSVEDFNAMARAYVALVVGMLAFTIPEAVTGNHILKDGAASIFGGPRAHYIDKRMGLERAFGSFDHPILYGVFSASAFSMAYYICARATLTNFKGMALAMGIVVATFISASGGPYVVLLMQIFVAGYDRAMKGITGRWRMLFTFFGLVYLAIDLFSNRTPFHVFVSYFTFSAHSAYNRINIWIYGTAEVGRNPIFGIGLGDWIRAPWMSDSMDNFWLLITVRYGLPALFFLLALMLGLVIAAGRRKNLPKDWINARHAWAFTLFGISVAAATVHLWNALFVLFMFLVGSGAWLVDTKPRSPRAPAPRNFVRPIGRPQTLF
ncbi:hypothetical protein [Aliiruegeria lutimaris]|nr:hypothetical protein [Aliiruegeria lutimaris]